MTQYQNQVVSGLIKVKNSNKKDIFTSIYVFQNAESIQAELILEAVAAMGEGFVVDICKKVLAAKEAGKKDSISEKQAWCIVYAFVKISDEALTEWYLSYCAEGQVEESVEEQNNEAVYVVRTSSANNEMNLHSTNEREFSTSSLGEARRFFEKEVEVLSETYATADYFPFTPSDAEYANAVFCEILKISECEIEVIDASDYFFEK